MNISDALSILKDNGFKYTNKREMLLTLFANERRYLSAKTVLEHMKSSYPGLSFDTIYRNLSVFTELGILEDTELDGEKHFRFTCSTVGHHHHVICLDCGKTRSIQSCPMSEVEVGNFAITDHKFEIYGYCNECQ
ncbi:Fur family transcriptional regulator [Pseudalkalibacillus decolorationis]|uniref:Fur family transcriptional regulator n=1 Tax=Pseudalkalibacillus decolorationis TaxID=163879 RepID=UPI002147C489|nr:Fur family transcriptional regulator [Pseudalkalibacillus decolorationis]